MKCASILSTLIALLAIAVTGVGFGSPGSPAPPPEKLVVHEWGTFLTVQGSDGVTLGGMVDSEESLPGFVMERTESAQERSQTRSRSSMRRRYPRTRSTPDPRVSGAAGSAGPAPPTGSGGSWTGPTTP